MTFTLSQFTSSDLSGCDFTGATVTQCGFKGPSSLRPGSTAPRRAARSSSRLISPSRASPRLISPRRSSWMPSPRGQFLRGQARDEQLHAGPMRGRALSRRRLDLRRPLARGPDVGRSLGSGLVSSQAPSGHGQRTPCGRWARRWRAARTRISSRRSSGMRASRAIRSGSDGRGTAAAVEQEEMT